ncbi:MAG: 50S ribosomal protein L21 [Thermotogae bacterium]|nr:50S ribosomal protein L21 [Thermotogota bacterium]MCP5465715.1 50S ribosomal protein L21 [Thermotogota bacterium]HOO75261.1 50S ribosomal protein L21 [Tepiditoga sp.]
MYAIIEFGGKQYRVEEGQTLYTEKINGVDEGAGYVFDRVIFVKDENGSKIGKPYVEGAKVSAEVVEHGKDEKLHIIKFEGRKQYRRKIGHRQHFTVVKIGKIEG